MSMTPIEVIDITTDTDPNDPTLYLAAASRALNMYRTATSRHGMNDLRMFEMLRWMIEDGRYPTASSPRAVMRQAIDQQKWIDDDTEGYGWEWLQEQTHDLIESLGYERADD